jgi:hypothetical protein
MAGKKKDTRSGKAGDDQDEVLAWLNNHTLEYAERYARQGRHLRATETEVLKRRWIELYRQWAAVAGHQPFDHTEIQDIEAELSLRGEEPPRDLVQHETEILKAAVERAAEQFERDPEHMAKVQREIFEEFQQFLKSTKAAAKN